MAEEAERIGARMRERREELGLKQREVAERVAGSTEGKDVSRWENGKHRPQSDTLEAIAQALETDVADLYAGPMAERGSNGSTPDLFGKDDSQLDRIEAKLDQLLAALIPASATAGSPAAPAPGDEVVEEAADHLAESVLGESEEPSSEERTGRRPRPSTESETEAG